MAESISPNDPGHGPLIISLSWILTTLATGTVALRFYVRKKFAGALSSDDWLMLAAIVRNPPLHVGPSSIHRSLFTWSRLSLLPSMLPGP